MTAEQLKNKRIILSMLAGFAGLVSLSVVSVGGALAQGVASQGAASGGQQGDASRPVLVISNSPVPKSILDKTYNYPTQATDIQPSDLVGSSYYRPTETMVSRKLRDLKSELAILQDKVVILSQALARLQKQNESQTAAYFAAVATINTQLQVGSTPGNPRLLERLGVAEEALEDLAKRLADFNEMSIDASKVATEASFLLDSSRATYGLSGAIEEDHVELAGMEDKVNTMIVLVNRVVNTVSDEIARTNSYLLRERENLRHLAVAVTNGSLYGAAQADRPFSGARDIRRLAAQVPAHQRQQADLYRGRAGVQAGYAPDYGVGFEPSSAAAYQGDLPLGQGRYSAAETFDASGDQGRIESEVVSEVEEPKVAPSQSDVAQEDASKRPLVKIRFDRSDVAYERPLNQAVSQVLERYPDVSFNILALRPALASAAEAAIEKNRVRRQARKIVKSLEGVGVDDRKISVAFDESEEIDVSEVHLYVH